MTTTTSIKVVGAKDLSKALRKVEGGIDDLKGVHADAAKIVERRASQLVPARTGRLGSSIRSSGQARQGVVRAGRASVPYAGAIHFGWAERNIKPQPFLYEALDSRRDEVLEEYERQVDDIVSKHL